MAKRKRITDEYIRTLKPGAGEYEVRVNEDGLFVRVRVNGRKVFVVRKGHRGRDFRITLGEYPDLSLEQARIKAGVELGRLKQEGDYRATERAERDRRAFTIADLVEAWTPEAEKRLNPKTLERHRGCIKNHISPAMGDRPLAAITLADVCALAAKIAAKGHPIQANRVVTLIGVLFRFARRRLGHDVANPAADFERHPEQSRERVLTDDEIRKVGRALDKDDVPPGRPIKLALMIALYTGMRANEVAGATCGEFDLQEKVWVVPPQRTKGKLDKRQPNIVPLTPRLIELVMQAPNAPGKAAPDAPLFPLDARKRRKRRNRAELPPLAPNAPMPRTTLTQGMATLCEVLKIEHASPHDLRRSASTVMTRIGVDYEVREAVLSHKTGSTVARIYNRHRYLSEKREALRKLGDELDRILSAPDNVVPLRARA